MANYTINIGSKFQPFSFERYLQPYLLIDREYRDIENQYDTLFENSSVWSDTLNPMKDPKSYAQFRNFYNDLEAGAKELSKGTLTPQSRNAMLEMKRRYKKEIEPIKNAYEKLSKITEEQKALKINDDSLVFDRDASLLSVDDLLRNPNLTYNSISGNKLAAQVSNAARAVSKDMRENPRKWYDILGGQYYETLMQTGFREGEVMDAILRNPNANNVLTSIVEDAIEGTDYRTWDNVTDNKGNLTNYGQELYNKIWRTASLGLRDAIGQTQYQQLANEDYIPQLNGDGNKDIYYETSPKITVDGKTKTSKIQDDINFIRKIIDNPQLLNASKEKEIKTGGTYNPSYNTVTQYPNLDKLEEISKKYGIDVNISFKDNKIVGTNLKELIPKLQDEIKKSAVKDLNYSLKISDNKLVIKGLSDAVSRYAAGTGVTGIKKYEDSKIGDYVNPDSIGGYINDKGEFTLMYDPDKGFIASNITKDGVKSGVLDIGLLDDPAGTLRSAVTNINKALEDGNPEKAKSYINGYTDKNGNYIPGIFEYLYYKFNSFPYVQGTSDSKIR